MTLNLDVEYDQIFIIDCLTEDQYNNWKISQDLMQYLADNGIQQTVSVCRNKKLVVSTLQHLAKLAASGTKFCLHIVSHGDENGLWIETTNEDITWYEFRNFLENINSSMGSSLIINMTSCLGLHGIKIVDEKSSLLPFFGLIGYSEDLEVDRGKEINNLFYKKMLDGKQINDIVDEIKIELTDKNLYCISSVGYKSIKNTSSRYK